ncbi:MAG: hypothetical protein AAFU79_01270 [Myxococcota bacterium]
MSEFEVGGGVARVLAAMPGVTEEAINGLAEVVDREAVIESISDHRLRLLGYNTTASPCLMCDPAVLVVLYDLLDLHSRSHRRDGGARDLKIIPGTECGGRGDRILRLDPFRLAGRPLAKHEGGFDLLGTSHRQRGDVGRSPVVVEGLTPRLEGEIS